VSIFCKRFDILIPDLGDSYTPQGRPRHKVEKITTLHHYHIDVFYAIIDLQLQELNDHFTEANTKLLLSMACLSPKNSFSAFDKDKLIRLAELYPKDFSRVNIIRLENQFDIYCRNTKQ
jgi:hypothetical protein